MALIAKRGQLLKSCNVEFPLDEYNVLRKEAHRRNISLAVLIREIVGPMIPAMKQIHAESKMEEWTLPERPRKVIRGICASKGPNFGRTKRLSEEG